MKTYRGVPGTPAVVVVVEHGKPPRGLDGGPFSWGKLPSNAVGARALSRAILTDVLGPDRAHDVDRLYSRFLWRRVAICDAASPFQVSDTEVLDLVEDIAKTERETAGMRARVALEPRPVANDGGIGVGGERIHWKSDGSKP